MRNELRLWGFLRVGGLRLHHHCSEQARRRSCSSEKPGGFGHTGAGLCVGLQEPKNGRISKDN